MAGRTCCRSDQRKRGSGLVGAPGADGRGGGGGAGEWAAAGTAETRARKGLIPTSTDPPPWGEGSRKECSYELNRQAYSGHPVAEHLLRSRHVFANAGAAARDRH